MVEDKDLEGLIIKPTLLDQRKKKKIMDSENLFGNNHKIACQKVQINTPQIDPNSTS